VRRRRFHRRADAFERAGGRSAKHGGADVFRFKHTHGFKRANGDAECNAGAECNADAGENAEPRADGLAGSHADSDSDANPDARSNTEPDADAGSDSRVRPGQLAAGWLRPIRALRPIQSNGSCATTTRREFADDRERASEFLEYVSELERLGASQ
jgi:hypothetical protein